MFFRSVVMTEQIVVESEILTEALKLTNSSDKRAVVNEALKVLIQMRRQQSIRELRGRLNWDGDLEAMRSDA
jgi:Arc/MetJ family transcription regulator